jgi:hypothetical protein
MMRRHNPGRRRRFSCLGLVGRPGGGSGVDGSTLADYLSHVVKLAVNAGQKPVKNGRTRKKPGDSGNFPGRSNELEQIMRLRQGLVIWQLATTRESSSVCP